MAAPNPLAQFFTALKEAKVPVGEEDLRLIDALAAGNNKIDPLTYFLYGFPCPQIIGFSAFPTPGASVDFYYYPGDFVTTHTTVVLDVTADPPVNRWTDGGVVPNASPYMVTIPAQANIGGVNQDVFEAGKTYMVGVFPTLGGFPIGCPRWAWVPVARSVPTMLLASALQVGGPFISTHPGTPPAAKK